jgi:hypothetical protein
VYIQCTRRSISADTAMPNFACAPPRIEHRVSERGLRAHLGCRLADLRQELDDCINASRRPVKGGHVGTQSADTELLGVAGERQRVRDALCADVGDDVNAAVGGSDPPIKDTTAECKRDMSTGRARVQSKGNACRDPNLSLSGVLIVAPSPVVPHTGSEAIVRLVLVCFVKFDTEFHHLPKAYFTPCLISSSTIG